MGVQKKRMQKRLDANSKERKKTKDENDEERKYIYIDQVWKRKKNM
jgi:hypothetical protein